MTWVEKKILGLAYERVTITIKQCAYGDNLATPKETGFCP